MPCQHASEPHASAGALIVTSSASLSPEGQQAAAQVVLAPCDGVIASPKLPTTASRTGRLLRRPLGLPILGVCAAGTSIPSDGATSDKERICISCFCPANARRVCVGSPAVLVQARLNPIRGTKTHCT